jgi:uncharacterized protein (DUF2249 family)
MAGRTSIRMASKISGNSVEDFFSKLKPLGFTIDSPKSKDVKQERPELPAFFNSLKPEQITEFDVRSIIEADKDPLPEIVKKVKEIQPGGALKIINSFEPTPLILLLKKQGFDSYADVINDQLVETYFYKTTTDVVEINKVEKPSKDWNELIEKFGNKTQNIDVRKLEMPGPMMAILDALEKLPADTALFVHHKRIPVFLLPELRERGFDFRIKEIADNEVYLLIFKE